MHCVRCGRPLTLAAKSIPSRNGRLNWGRVCALKSGLIDPKPRQRQLVTHQQAQEVDESQLSLELAA